MSKNSGNSLVSGGTVRPAYLIHTKAGVSKIRNEGQKEGEKRGISMS